MTKRLESTHAPFEANTVRDRFAIGEELPMKSPQPSFWDLVAGKLTRQPELIAVARENCARWLREGHSGAGRLREWDDVLAEAQRSPAGMARLQTVLAGAGEAATRLRDFHPFAGLLTREERRQARELCGYRH